MAELGRSVNRMAADLERSKALDQQFLLSVSHDLRTPLTAISGYAEALQDGAVADPSGAGAIIGNHAKRLDRLVGDLLDLAKLDANRFRLDLRPVGLAVVSGRTVAGLAAKAAGHGVTIDQRTDAEATVLADPDRLAQVIANLVDNAINFATERVLVTIVIESPASSPTPLPSADGGPGANLVAKLTVSDDGPGFATEDLPYVFDRLYTGSARPRRSENSSGLGLAIVRELVGAMGGTVAAGNGANGGAAIAVWLPVHQPADVTTEVPMPLQPNQEPPVEPPRALPAPPPPA
ncbi:MAG: HAMP domain-containing sensor histidine kinase, partial [Actinomycetota bacterium]